MRARSRSCPRRLVAGLVAAGTIEIAAGALDAAEDALLMLCAPFITLALEMRCA